MTDTSQYYCHMQIDLRKQKTVESVSEVIRRCPKCNSVFVSISDCESCGFQFSFKNMKYPTSKRGFYGLKESFLESRTWLDKFRSSRASRGYVRKLNFRYNELVEYLCSNPESDIHPVYKQEFNDLIKELLDHKTPQEELWLRLDKSLMFKKHGFLGETYSYLSSQIDSNQKYDLFSGNAFYGIRVRFLFSTLFLVFSFLFCSMALYRHLII